MTFPRSDTPDSTAAAPAVNASGSEPATPGVPATSATTDVASSESRAAAPPSVTTGHSAPGPQPDTPPVTTSTVAGPLGSTPGGATSAPPTGATVPSLRSLVVVPTDTTAAEAARSIVDQLLTICGYRITKYTRWSADDGIGWSAWTPEGQARFVVYDPFADWFVDADDETAFDLATECDFFSV